MTEPVPERIILVVLDASAIAHERLNQWLAEFAPELADQPSPS